jgi:hypothetical protein
MSLLSISRRVFVGAGGSAAAWVLSGGRAIFSPALAAESSKRPRPKITISKETTYIERPLRPDGYPDYLAAVNELGRKDVTPENNAAIPFWQAIGPKEIPSEVREKYFAMLGVPVPPEQGAYLVSLGDFLPRYKGWKNPGGDTPEDEAWLREVYNQFEKAQSRPWSKKQYPAIAALLETNDKPLDQLVAATRRARWWSPIVAKKDSSLFQSEWMSGIMATREAARQLIVRAMLRLESGETDAAWEDVLACHRLAGLVVQEPFAVHYLVAVSHGNMASLAAVRVAQHAKLTINRARKCQADLRGLPPMPRVQEKWEQGERLFSLDYLLTIAERGPRALTQNVVGEGFVVDLEELMFGGKRNREAVERLASDSRIDWEEVLRQQNRASDRVVVAYGRPTYCQRSQALEQLAKEAAKGAAEVVEHMPSLEALPADEAPKMIARHLFQILSNSGLASAAAMAGVETRGDTMRQVAQLAFALAAYRHEQGSYPPRLGNLAPKYIPGVPKDPFTDRELVYKPQKDSYLVYSLGPNQRDDGGRSHLDPEEQAMYEKGTDPQRLENLPDDIAICTPTRR